MTGQRPEEKRCPSNFHREKLNAPHQIRSLIEFFNRIGQEPSLNPTVERPIQRRHYLELLPFGQYLFVLAKIRREGQGSKPRRCRGLAPSRRTKWFILSSHIPPPKKNLISNDVQPTESPAEAAAHKIGRAQV